MDNPIETSDRYENCISLGWYCGTASSLSKLGLRSHAGPFDWYFSDYWAVLKQIEMKFSDFMTKSNLEIYDEAGKEFTDKVYGFHCNHDIKKDFDHEYPQIYERYMRRAKRFLEDIQTPSILFRTVRNEEEIKYINDNWEYAENLLKKFNKNNRIVYLYRDGLVGLTNNVESFHLNISKYGSEKHEMRYMFDSSAELIEYTNALISIEQMRNNKEYDLAHNS